MIWFCLVGSGFVCYVGLLLCGNSFVLRIQVFTPKGLVDFDVSFVFCIKCLFWLVVRLAGVIVVNAYM